MDGSKRYYEKRTRNKKDFFKLSKEIGKILKQNHKDFIENKMHILLTRPLEDSIELITKFKKLGIQFLIYLYLILKKSIMMKTLVVLVV